MARRIKKILEVSDYETVQSHGWTVHVEKSLRKPPRRKQAMELLDGKLLYVEEDLPASALPALKKIPIWLNKDIRRGACYHPNPEWLESNDRMPEKVRSIEFQNIDNFIDWSSKQPMMVLHELAHAFHH